jgi:phosphatidate cytidylyltransferase
VTRILSGILLGGVVGAAIVWAPPSVLLGIAVLFAALAAGEFVALAEAAGAPVPRTPTIVAAGALCAAVPWAGAVVAPVVIAVVLTQAALAVGWLAPDANTIARVSIAVFGPLYVGLPLGSLVAVHWSGGPAAALLLIGTIVISDTAQYYGGRLLGRRPLAPVLSPKKTVEGAVAGMVVGTVAFTLLGGRLWPSLPITLLAVVGLSLVVLGITGDLFESMLKRGVGAKDSSTLIPGHGGVLDRIDALLFAAPVYYVIVRFAVRVA